MVEKMHEKLTNFLNKHYTLEEQERLEWLGDNQTLSYYIWSFKLDGESIVFYYDFKNGIITREVS